MKDLKKSFLVFFKKHWPLLAIVLLVGSFFWKVFLQNKIPLPGDFVLGVYSPWIDHGWSGYGDRVPVKNPIMADVVSFTFPMQTRAIAMMKSGQWPLWNPYILAGTPLLANFQSAPFAITNVFYVFFNTLSAWSLRIILQHLLAAVFTYLLLRHWKVSKVGAAAGGVFFAFAGFNVIWSQWNAHVLTAAFIPLIFLFEDRYLVNGKIRNGVALSVCISLQIFSGYPQVVIYTLGAMCLLWLVRFKGNKSYFIRSICLFIFVMLGFAVSAPQLLPARELLQYSQRSTEPHPYEWAFLPWQKIITFVAPDYFGNHATGNWWGLQDYTSNTGFVGIIPLSFALIAVTKKRTEIVFLLFVLLFSLLLSFPTLLSITLWKSGLLGMQAASAHRALVLENLSLALLSGFGIDRILLNKKIKLRALLPILLLVVVFVGLSFLPPFSAHRAVALRNLFFPCMFLVITFLLLALARAKQGKVYLYTLLVLGVFELFRFGWKFTPFTDRALVFPETPVLTYLMKQPQPFRTTGANVIPINLRMNYGISTLEGYDAVYPTMIANFLGSLNGVVSENGLGRYAFVNDDISRLLNITNVTFVLAKREKDGTIPSRFVSENYESITLDEPQVLLLKNKLSKPRSFVFYNWETLSADKALEKIINKNFNSEKVLLLDKNILTQQPGGGKSQVVYKRISETENVMEVSTSKKAVLFSSDTYFPGWRAYVDNIETPIIRADYAFRAVEIPKGTHTVTYVYHPDSFFNGLKISLISFVVLAGVLFVPLFKRRSGQYN